MSRQLLNELAVAQSRYGEQRQAPCTDDRLEQLRRRVREELGAELPDEHIALLRAQDGVNHNGLFIYASETATVVGTTNATIQGIVEANMGWRDDEQMVTYLVFGEGNLDLYARHLPTGEYHVIDRVPGNLIETHPTFDQLLAAAIRAHP